MRDEGTDEVSAASRHNELRDIHHRIDSLKEENERQYTSLTEKLHALEVAVVRGSRFPAVVWVSAAAVVLSVFGTGAVLYGKLETTSLLAQQAVRNIETHITVSAQGETAVAKMDERVKGLESRCGRQEDQQAALCQRVQLCKGK